METIAIVDTSICTNNLGDEIIMDSVNQVVGELFPEAYIFRVPSHEPLTDRTRRFIQQSSWCFIGGTNLLSSDIRRKGLWKVTFQDALIYGSTHTVCLGTGWNDYMPDARPRTKRLLTTALSSGLVHSVRDTYTRSHLSNIGLSAVSTCCPTTWSLTPQHCSTIPRGRASSVVFTLSAWRPEAEADRSLVALLRRHYKKIYFFPQMGGDYEYFKTFGWEDVSTLTPTTQGYTRFLENEDVDFVGTRLHGGIRALQKGRRSLVLAIDNRAAEISKDTGLPVLARADRPGIENWIEGGAETVMRLPYEVIDEWKAQFSPENRRLVPVPIKRDSARMAANRGIRVAKRAIKFGLGLS